jgi:iron complex transport system permease protein
VKSIAISFIILLALLFCSLFFGSGDVAYDSVRRWLSGQDVDESTVFILQNLRLPRTLVCISVGASLGLAGALLQTLLRNPLAEPYTLGLSGGASLGAILAILLRLQPQWLFTPFFATIGCLLATLFVLGMNRDQSSRSKTLILSGVMVSLFCGSFVILLLTWLEPFQIQSALFWMMGQVGTERDSWWYLSWLVFLLLFIYAFFNARKLDLLLLGEDVAQTRGLPLRKFQIQMVICVAILCSTSVAIAGLIGFVGLLAPHISLLSSRTNRHRIFLVLSSCLGAVLLLLADVLARLLVTDRELPAGGLIALFGAPFLIYLLNRRAGRV